MIRIFNEVAPLPVLEDTVQEIKEALLTLQKHAFVVPQTPHYEDDGPWERMHRHKKLNVASVFLGKMLKNMGDHWGLAQTYGFKLMQFDNDFSSFKAYMDGARDDAREYHYTSQSILEELEQAALKDLYNFEDQGQKEEFLTAVYSVKSFFAHLRAQKTPQINNNLIYRNDAEYPC